MWNENNEIDLTTWNKVLQKSIIAQLIEKFPAFMKREGPLPCSQNLVTAPYPKRDGSSIHVHPQTLFLSDPF
jgi:hypothetical protein